MRLYRILVLILAGFCILSVNEVLAEEHQEEAAEESTEDEDVETEDVEVPESTEVEESEQTSADQPPPRKGPDIVLIESEQKTIYEYRQNGRLTMIKVVPRKGKPYYLVPDDPTKYFGDLERAERLVPRWILKEF